MRNEKANHFLHRRNWHTNVLKEPSPIFKTFFFLIKLLEVWYHKKAQIFLIHNCFIHSNGLTISIENLNVHIWSDDSSNETEKQKQKNPKL